MTADTDIELNFGKPIPKALPGTYPAILVGIVPFRIGEGTPEAKTLIRWEFSLDGTDDPEQPGFPVIVEGVTSTATGKRSKMRPWVSVLLGREFGDDDRLSLSALQAQAIGHPCLVTVFINDDGYSKVENVLPPLRQPARPAGVPVAVVPSNRVLRTPPDHDESSVEASVVADMRHSMDAVAQPMTTLPNMAEPEGPTSLPPDPDETPFR